MVTDTGAGTAIVQFNGGMIGVTIPASSFEVFNGVIWIASTLVTGTGNQNRTFTNVGLDGGGGQPWRILTAPAAIRVPQSGLTTI